MINQNNFNEIEQLGRGDIAFPLIDYHLNLPLQLPATTILAAYTTISKKVDPVFLDGLEWNANGDIAWQNVMLQQLSNGIYAMIEEYNANPNDELLTKIFIRIQLWGGNAGRSVFNRGNGWPGNFRVDVYRSAVQEIANINYTRALATMNSMYGIATAFSTKHIHFWSNANAPIYDSIISEIVFGRNTVREKDYSPYINALDALVNEINNDQVNRSAIERSLFNWANTDLGKKWRKIRLTQQ